LWHWSFSLSVFCESGFSMNATSRTMVFVGVAAVAALAAMGVRFANQPAAIEGFSDVGQEFFADFKDPLKAMELSVVKYDTETREPLSFSVKQNDKGFWVIPSHHDYPAEAAERLAKTAASLIGIKKVALQSRSKDDWARYGVEDPSAEVAAAAAEGDDEKDETRGTRITLRDNSSNSLVDLIVGKAVEGRDKHFYVRQPDKNPVFIAKLDADLSAKFSDWIEPDLLKLNQNDIVKVTVDQYSVDEEQGAILKGEVFDFQKDKTTSKWTMEGLNTDMESLKEAAVTDITRNLDQLKIVGVRPKPEGLNADLTVSPEVAQNPLLRQVLQSDMQRQGFYIARGENNQVKLVSNEGELLAGTNNGVSYTLYFGEIARGTAKDIETGLNDKKPVEGEAEAEGGEAKAEGEKPAEGAEADAAKPEDKPEDTESGPRRYLLVKVDYDESLLGPKPTEPVAPEKPAILNEGAPAPADEKKPEAPADAPKEGAPAAEEKPAADAAPQEEAPKEETPAPEKAADPAAEEPAEPGSCDEPDAAEPAAVADPAAPAQDAAPAAEAKPAEPAAAAPAQEGQPAPAEGEKPAAETPATATPADGAAPAAAPAQPPVDPKAEAQKQYDQAMGEYEAAKAGFEGALKAWESKAKEGKKKADELSARFGAWYYVISADSFEKFKLTRDAVVGPKEGAKPADGAAGPGAGGPPSFDLPGLGNPGQ
jgi:hypothetical protein